LTEYRNNQQALKARVENDPLVLFLCQQAQAVSLCAN
jgi:hypothetical protein